MTRANVSNFFRTNLSAQVADTDLTFPVDTTVDGPTSPCYLVFEPENSDRREIVWCDGTFSGSQFVTSEASNRYLEGSAQSSGITHPSGAAVWAAIVAQHIDDVWDEVDGKAADPHGDSAHNALSYADDPHGNSAHSNDYAADDHGHDGDYQPQDLYVERSGKDAEGIFTVVEHFRADTEARFSRSELSGGSTPEYAQREVTWYEADGTTERDSVTYDLSYDGDGDLTGEGVSA